MISVWIVHIYSLIRKISKKGHFRLKDIKIVKPKRVQKMICTARM